MIVQLERANMSRYNRRLMALMESEDFYSLKQAADKLKEKGYGGTTENVRSLIKRGKFTKYEFCGHPVVLKSEVESYEPMDRSQRRMAGTR